MNDSAHMDPAAQAHADVVARNEYYRDQFRKAWTTIWALCGLLACSLMLNIVQFVGRDHPLPIAVTPDWRVVPLTPIDEFSLSDEGVRNWAARTLPSLYNLDFRNNKQQVASLEKIFTPEGYAGYLEALARNKLLDTIKSNNYVVTANPKETPQVVKRVMLKGSAAWMVRAPMTVTFDNGSTPVTQNLMITTYIKRVPESENPFGIQIHSFAAARE